MEQLILTKQKELHLQPWEEIIGTLKELKTGGETTTAILTCTHNTDYSISYPNGTKEAETLQTLQNSKGQKIAILRTDIPEKPILIQHLERNHSSLKNSFDETIVSSKSISALTKCFTR
jgi:hypothetical protein